MRPMTFSWLKSFLVCDSRPVDTCLPDDRAHRLQSSMAVFLTPRKHFPSHAQLDPRNLAKTVRAREGRISVVAVADVAIEPDVDLPGPALRLHEVGQHGVRALGYGLDVPAQHLHEVGD